MKKLFFMSVLALATNAQAQWSLTGNSGTNPATNFLGTTDDKDVIFRRNNARIGSLGTSNIALGLYALNSNSSGTSNTSVGGYSLYSNTSGYYNSAFGYLALSTNTVGNRNTAIGSNALGSSNGYDNSAIGNYTLPVNTSGDLNSAVGSSSLSSNTTGSYNTAVGGASLASNTTGNYNTAIGYNAGVAVNGLNNTLSLGYGTNPTASNQVILGNTSVTSILGYNNVSITSDGRFKQNITENVPGLAFINQLKPVTYNYKIHELNSFMGITNTINERNKDAESLNELAVVAKEKIVYSGFIAQEVEKAAEKAGYNFSGIHKPQNEKDAYALSYAEFVVPLVKAVQELSTSNVAHKSEIEELKKGNADLKNDNKQLRDKLNRIEEQLNKLINNHSGTTELNNNTTVVLDQNAPNPFAESTTINYSIDTDFSAALIAISNSNGVVIKTYPITTKGKSQLTVYGSNLSSGVYHYSLIVDGKTIETKSMVKN